MPAPLSDSALEAKRGRILDAARRVCRRSDLDSAKMADIAAEARVSKGTLYRFFQSKEDLLLEMLRQGLHEVDDAVERTVGEATGRDGLQAYIELIVELVPTTLEMSKLTFQAQGFASRDQETLRRLFETYWNSYSRRGKLLEELIRQGQAAGQFRANLDSKVAATVLMAMTDGLSWRCNLDEEIRKPDQMRAAFHEMVLGWTPSSVVGPGNLGKLIAGGALNHGRTVVPILRGTNPSIYKTLAPRTPVLVSVPEAELKPAVAAVPLDRRADLVLVQNELFPSVWRQVGAPDPTVAVVWILVKPRVPVTPLRTTGVRGRHAGLLVEILRGLGLPAAVLGDDASLGRDLVAKYAFILTINALGHKADVTVGEWLKRGEGRIRPFIHDALALGRALLGRPFPEDNVVRDVIDAMASLKSSPAKGRTAAARVAKAQADAERLGITLTAIGR